MKLFTSSVASLAIALCVGGQASATIFSEDFEVDPTANWTVNDSALSDISVNFNYDYSAIGVPSAPNGAGTSGLKMSANSTGGVFSGFSVSPTGQSFSGNYQVKFDLWQNYVGPVGPGGSGTTQLSFFGVGTSGTEAMWAGAATKESVTFGVTLDGGSSVDYRIYDSANPTGRTDAASFAGGADRNGSNPYYAVFGGDAAPVDQVTLYPAQTGVTDAGEIAFAWREVTIDVIADVATMSIDGLPIGIVDMSALTLGGGNILFGHGDTNNGSSSDPNAELLNVTLIDNVQVSQLVPEPSSVLLSLAAAAGGLFFRKRS
ncbi:hypothetical protein Pla123a_20430 [Posidoniimonas polymericola]|uniref:PEP-CTERM protein-sorting domain-containing protein n=1 Tax=Posidoniimonas polymericola TaxID=2528002 RepID=A0A5C5YR06_9BACT|nr:PEP-CTERM sorting domain-containing protein [Posidoniimonas polymericola]TWT77382.1 hypothetical protein Pla123a_20430 [Posidoniimonas polymericola]